MDKGGNVCLAALESALSEWNATALWAPAGSTPKN
jgi:hypothetical protein